MGELPVFTVLQQAINNVLPAAHQHWVTRTFGDSEHSVQAETLMQWYRQASDVEKSPYVRTSLQTLVAQFRKFDAQQPQPRRVTPRSLRALYNTLQAMQARNNTRGASQGATESSARVALPTTSLTPENLFTQGVPSRLSVVHMLRVRQEDASRFQDVGDIAGFTWNEWQNLHNSHQDIMWQKLGNKQLFRLRENYARMSHAQLVSTDTSQLQSRSRGPAFIYRMLLWQRQERDSRGRQRGQGSQASSQANSRAGSQAPSSRASSRGRSPES